MPPDELRVALADADYTVEECHNCLSLFQAWIPNELFSEELYSVWLAKDDFLAPDTDAITREQYFYLAGEAAALIEHQRQTLGSRSRLRVLDFGMGWGKWLQFAKAFGADVYGMELSIPKRENALRNGITLLDWDQLNDLQFDLISIDQVLEHVGEPLTIAKTLAKALAPKGILKISVPAHNGVRATISALNWDRSKVSPELLMPIHPLEHLQCFSPLALKLMATQLGLEQTKVPYSTLINSSMGLLNPKTLSKSLLRPLFRFYLKRGGYALYRKR